MKSTNKKLFIWLKKYLCSVKGLQLDQSAVIWYNCVPQSSKGSECLFWFKRGWSLLIKRLSIKVTLKYCCLLAWKKRQNQLHDCKVNDCKVFLWQNLAVLLSSPFKVLYVQQFVVLVLCAKVRWYICQRRQ